MDDNNHLEFHEFVDQNAVIEEQIDDILSQNVNMSQNERRKMEMKSPNAPDLMPETEGDKWQQLNQDECLILIDNSEDFHAKAKANAKLAQLILDGPFKEHVSFCLISSLK